MDGNSAINLIIVIALMTTTTQLKNFQLIVAYEGEGCIVVV
jgi:hypothetical protein